MTSDVIALTIGAPIGCALVLIGFYRIWVYTGGTR